MTALTSTPVPAPSPGAVAWVRTAETVTTPHGDHTTIGTHRWDGYTAADLRAHWTARAKNARWDHVWDDEALTVTMTATGTGKTITRTFHDEEPA